MTAQKQSEVGNIYSLPFHLMLRAARAIQGVSQEKIARRMDVSVNTYRLWERGEYLPHLDVYAAMCAALDLDPMAALTTLPEHGRTTGYANQDNLIVHPAAQGVRR